MKMQLYTPGPVSIPEQVLSFSAQQPMSHRNPLFFSLMERLQRNFSTLLRSEGPVVILPSSGTGALEALCSNFIRPGDRVLSVSCGVFGDRFREIARCQGGDILSLDVPYGCSVNPEQVYPLFMKNPGIKVLLLTHNETSTGVLNPVQKIIQSLPDPKPLILVDAVSSLGAIPCFPEEWNIDGLASCSQKGLLTPPGVGFVWLSQRAWEKLGVNEGLRGYYFDLLLHRKYLDRKDPQNPFTPPVSLLQILDRSLSFILEYGLENWFISKERLSRSFLAGITAMGLEPLVLQKDARSPGVSSVVFPNAMAGQVHRSLSEMGIIASGGQGKLSGHIMRFAHYSDHHWSDVSMLLGCLYGALVQNGFEAASDYISYAWSTWDGGEE